MPTISEQTKIDAGDLANKNWKFVPQSRMPKEPPTPPRPQAPAPEPPILPDRVLDAPSAQVMATAQACCGGNFETARHMLLNRRRDHATRLKRFAPAAWSDVEFLVTQWRDIRTKILETIDARSGVIYETENAMKDLGHARKAQADVEARLRATEQQLDDPKSLDASAEIVAKLTNDLRHLPAKVTEAKAVVVALESKIKTLVADGGVDLLALLKHMDVASGKDPNRADLIDAPTHALFTGGWMTPPK